MNSERAQELLYERHFLRGMRTQAKRALKQELQAAPQDSARIAELARDLDVCDQRLAEIESQLLPVLC